MSKQLLSANDVPIGHRVRVQQVSSDEHQIDFERLLEMGVFPGRYITLLYRPPGGAVMLRTDGGHPIMIASSLAMGILCGPEEK